MLYDISILAGINKNGVKENFDRLDLKLGEAISILGATGSGKTALITDIELLSQGDSITKRRILIDGETPSEEARYNPIFKPIAMITQNTKCFSDLYVDEFLEIHARARGVNNKSIVENTVTMANLFTGEPIQNDLRITELSGGQTRSLLIADAITIGSAPIILLDEIENAGINKNKIIENIKFRNKLIIFVTHDPVIALQTEKRIIMKNGSISKVISRNSTEILILEKILLIDEMLCNLRNRLRSGEEFQTELDVLFEEEWRIC